MADGCSSTAKDITKKCLHDKPISTLLKSWPIKQEKELKNLC
jgi:hypothetical protein